MPGVPKQLEMNPRVINLYDRTIRELYLRALKGLRQPFVFEFSDEDGQIFCRAGILRSNGGEPTWNRNYAYHRGRLTISVREHTRVSRTIDTNLESEKL
jgi:hypothetical protein